LPLAVVCSLGFGLECCGLGVGLKDQVLGLGPVFFGLRLGATGLAHIAAKLCINLWIQQQLAGFVFVLYVICLRIWEFTVACTVSYISPVQCKP